MDCKYKCVPGHQALSLSNKLIQEPSILVTKSDIKALSSPIKALHTARKRALGMWDYLAFGAGLLGAIYINVGGNLYLAEILLLVLLPYLIYRRAGLLRFGPFRVIMFLGAGWFINQVVTDLYRETSPADILKGWLLIVFFFTNFLALYLLVFPNPRRIALGLLGHAIGLALQPVIQPTGDMLASMWKFGLGYPITLLLALIGVFLCNKNPRRTAGWSIVLIIVAIYSFYVRSRSLGGVTLLAALVIWFRFTRFGRGLAQRFNNPIGIMLSILLLFAVILGVYQAYGYAAMQGYFGEGARYLYQTEASGYFGALLGGRKEWLPAMYSLRDSPVIGYGSYAHNTDYGQYLYQLTSLGYTIDINQLDIYLASINSIPTHSHLLQGWVWAGLAGGVFWFFIIGFILRTMILAYRHPGAFFIVTVFFGFFALWTALFSPLSNIGRLEWAFILVTLLYAQASQPKSPRDSGDAPRLLNS